MSSAVDVDRGGDERSVSRGDRSVRQQTAVFETHSGRPMSIRGEVDELPDCGVGAMQQKRPTHLGAVQDREYAISDRQRLAAVLLGNFYENSQDPFASVQVRQAFGVGAGGQSGLDADAALSQLFHYRRGGAFSRLTEA